VRSITRTIPVDGTGWILIAILLGLLVVFPIAYTDQYILSLMTTAFILLVLNSSWNFLLGVGGVWNFGQLAIYALGGYGAGLLMIHTPLPPLLDIIIGGFFSAAVAIALAFPTLRLYGIYTSLLTFSFAEIVQFAILNDNSGFTGGPFGLPNVSGLFPTTLSDLWTTRAYYWTALTAAALTVIGLAVIVHSRLGLALQAIRDAPTYAAARGISPLKYRVIAFGIGGFFAGVAGGLYVSNNGTIQPTVMGLTPMSIDVTMLVVGGLGTAFGPVVGTALLIVIDSVLSTYPGVEFTVLGVVLLVIVVFVPGGLVGEITRQQRRLATWLAEGDADD
jgi:branched-chain amino acid transport system permease protein